MDVRPNGIGFADIRPYSTRPAASQWSTLLATDIKVTKYTIPSPALLCRARLGRGRLGSGLGEGLEGTSTPCPCTSEDNVADDSTPFPHRPCFAEHACVAGASETGWARDSRALTRRALRHRKKTSRPTCFTCCVPTTFLWAGCMNMFTWAYYSQYSGVNSKTHS